MKNCISIKEQVIIGLALEAFGHHLFQNRASEISNKINNMEGVLVPLTATELNTIISGLPDSHQKVRYKLESCLTDCLNEPVQGSFGQLTSEQLRIKE